MFIAVEVMTPAASTAVYLYRVAEGRPPERLHPAWEERWQPPVFVRLRYFTGRARALVLSVAAPGEKGEEWAWYAGNGELARWNGP